MDNYKRLTRSTTDRRIAGVCGGVAKYLNIDPTVVRILFLIALISAPSASGPTSSSGLPPRRTIG